MTKSPNSKSCSGCKGDVSDPKNALRCKTEACQKVFHNLCINAAKLSTTEKANWICPECKAASRKGGDNSTTPVRIQATDNVTMRKKPAQQTQQPKAGTETMASSSAPLPTPKGDFAELTAEIKLLRCDMSDIKEQLATAMSSLAKCHDHMDVITHRLSEAESRLSDTESRLSDTESRLQALEDQQAENVVLKAAVQDLQNRYNIQAQLALRNDIEIIGCPETKNENLHHILMITATKIGATISDTDIDYVTRAGPKRKPTSSNSNPSPRPVIVRFARRKARDDFLAKSRTRRAIDTTGIISDCAPQKLYINERLTRENRQLFRSARERASQARFKHCWTRSGFIYTRRRDGGDAIHITDNDCMERVFGRAAVATAAPEDSSEPEGDAEAFDTRA